MQGPLHLQKHSHKFTCANIHTSLDMLWVHQVTLLLKNEIQSSHFFPSPSLVLIRMPGTIQLSVLELMDLPQPEPTISSLSLKVTVGKREYQSMGKEDFSFPVMTLLGNLIVMLHDAEGNEMLRTELRTISVVEKGLWIDSFPLKGGGLIQMKLQFSLSQEEHIRIREMRETVLKRKRGEQVKSGVKSPLSEQGNNKGITYSITKGSLRAQLEQEGTDQSESSGTQSLQVSEEHPERLPEKAESPPDVIAQVPIPSEESLGPKSGTSLSSVSEKASQNNNSISAAMEEDQNLSSVKKMVNAFESSQFQEHRSRGLRMKYSVDKFDREGSLKRVSSEESDIISKSETPQTIAKSFSSGMLSDMHQQRGPKILQSASLRKEGAEHLIPDSQQEAKGTGKATLSFKKDQKLKDTSLDEDRADKEPTGSKKPANSLKLAGLVSEREGRRQGPYPMSSKRNFGTAKEKPSLGAVPKGSNTLYEHIAVGKSGAMPEPSSQNEEDLEAECKLTPTKICPNGDGTDDGNVTSKQNTSDHLQLSHEVKLDGTHSCSQTIYQQGLALQTVTGKVECSRSLSGDIIIRETPSEAADLLTYADIEGNPSGNLGIWGPRHLCITTGSRQLRDLAECCHNSRRSSPTANGNLSTKTNDDKKQHCDASVLENENERITSCASGKSEHEKSASVSKPKSYAGLIEQGVRIAVVIVACGTLLLNTRPRKPGKTIPESKRR